MAGVFLTSFLLLLPHLVPAKVFLVETEAENNETGEIEEDNSGSQDYIFGFRGPLHYAEVGDIQRRLGLPGRASL